MHVGGLTNHEDLKNSSYENSSDLGEVERERVRQIFREWMNIGAEPERREEERWRDG